MLRQMEAHMSDSQQVGLGMTNTIAKATGVCSSSTTTTQRRNSRRYRARRQTLFQGLQPYRRRVHSDRAPDRTEVPPTPDLDKMLEDYKSAMTVSEGEAFDPTPANIEAP